MNMEIFNKDSWCVVFRTGGTLMFTWRYTLPVIDKAYAQQQKADIERQGYRAMVWRYSDVLTIGLPETYDATTPVENAE